MKIIALSDLHGFLPDTRGIPECDVVCIAGDIVPLKMQRNCPQSRSWLRREFVPWAQSLNCSKVMLVAGNHDFVFDVNFRDDINNSERVLMEEITSIFHDTKVCYLNNSEVMYEGMRFYGVPQITGLRGWAFYVDDDEEYMMNIPDCAVLITHAPPYGDVGTVLQKNRFNTGENYGSINLRKRMEYGGIGLCVSGHIHSGLHEGEIIGETVCYNVSLKDENYNVTYEPTKLVI